MKFGKYLISVVNTTDPEWAMFFLNYKALKWILRKKRTSGQEIEEKQNGGSGESKTGEENVLASTDISSEMCSVKRNHKLGRKRRNRDDGIVSHGGGMGIVLNRTVPGEYETNTARDIVALHPLELDFFRRKQ